MARFVLIRASILALLFGLVAWDSGPKELATGQWRAVVELPGGTLPFTLDVVNPDGPGVKACVINGEERFPMTHTQISGDYELLVAGSSDTGKAPETLPMLNDVIAYPTMIVIDRSGAVRRVHTGFEGPGTGEKYHEFRREFTAFIEQLLAEEQS